MRHVLACIEPSQYYVLASSIYVTWGASFQKWIHRLLMAIVCNAVATEWVVDVLIYNGWAYGFVYTISIAIHNCLWLALLLLHDGYRLKALWPAAAYLLFSFTDLLWIEGTAGFNYLSFLAGAFLYLILYMRLTITYIKAEKFDFFLTNVYLLLTTPVLFYLGLSFILGFRDQLVTGYKLIGGMSLYGCTVTFVNAIYYTMINLYIYKERKIRSCQN